MMVYRHQQRLAAHFKSVNDLKIYHENALLVSQIEIQEQTFQNIAREIHDNIGQKLSLAKLYLVNLKSKATDIFEIDDSIEIIGAAISDLRDMSRTMSADAILNDGFVNALETEIKQLNKTALFQIDFVVSGETIFLEGKNELILFRIVQECLQNIFKHAEATKINIRLIYESQQLMLEIQDNSSGFDPDNSSLLGQGLGNMKKRTAMLGGKMCIESNFETGSIFTFRIPTNAE